MDSINKPHVGLRIYRLFLTFVALVILGLNIQSVVWMEQSRKAWAASDDPIDYPFAQDYIALLVPDLAMFVMFMLLLVGRLRFNNQKLHSICRILFSLTLAFGLVYWPARLIQAQVQMAKWMERPFGEMYFCSTENITYGDNTLRMCRTRVARDMFSFIAGFLVVVELVFAAVVGEIGIH